MLYAPKLYPGKIRGSSSYSVGDSVYSTMGESADSVSVHCTYTYGTVLLHTIIGIELHGQTSLMGVHGSLLSM